MPNMFSNESRQFKFDVLVDIARQAATTGKIDEDAAQRHARNLVSLNGPRVRCCVYKEREVLRQRVRLAMGKMANEDTPYNPKQVVQVIDAACNGCTIKKIRVTDNCRKCMAKKCVAACHFDAMHIGTTRAEIDYDKCKECGACAKECPYSAIVVTERPCLSHCPVQAISYDESNIAVIDDKKCINCGQCENACPFGAIEDVSWVAPVLRELVAGQEMHAVVAPSIQGQFNANIAQICKGIEMIGFKSCLEAAIGADAVAEHEAEELKEAKEAGKPLTTSCCPGFVNMLKIHFPDQYANNKSTTVSPMEATARLIKRDHPNAKVVFVGPCIAKKTEAMEDYSCVDYVLTFEEIAAMLIGHGIDPFDVEIQPEDKIPSNYARNFSQSGGVAAAVAEVAKEKGEGPYTAFVANGALECKKQLTLMKFGKFQQDILEGMCCTGGCVGGPACIMDAATVKGRMVKENIANAKKTVQGSLEQYDLSGVNMSVKE